MFNGVVVGWGEGAHARAEAGPGGLGESWGVSVSEALDSSSSSVCSALWYSMRAWVLWVMVMVQGPWAHGSPSTCMGIVELLRTSWRERREIYLSISSHMIQQVYFDNLQHSNVMYSNPSKIPSKARSSLLLLHFLWSSRSQEEETAADTMCDDWQLYLVFKFIIILLFSFILTILFVQFMWRFLSDDTM